MESEQENWRKEREEERRREREGGGLEEGVKGERTRREMGKTGKGKQ